MRCRSFDDQAIAANVHRQNNNLNATAIQSVCSNLLLLRQNEKYICAYGHIEHNHILLSNIIFNIERNNILIKKE